MSHDTVVFGLGFGDEGKGRTVDNITLRSSKSDVVVRFNGGAQAGHTVQHGETRHVFSHFGSGTLNGTPTYWSKYCPVSPIAYRTEKTALLALGVRPQIMFDPECPITTPLDIGWNRFREGELKHGTVGAGYGATLMRDALTPDLRLHLRDTLFLPLFRWKLKAIWDWYAKKLTELMATWDNSDGLNPDFYGSVFDPKYAHATREQFIEWVNDEADFRNTGPLGATFSSYRWVFEGAQGLLLDQEYGFFPHVTYGRTGPKQALQLRLEEGRYHGHCDNDVYLIGVVRTYLTRHGRGPLFGDPLSNPSVVYGLDKTNVRNPWQGKMEVRRWDKDLLRYSISCVQQEMQSLGLFGDRFRVGITWADTHEVEDVLSVLSEKGIKLAFHTQGPSSEQNVWY